MNFLAHVFLSGDNEKVMVGNFIGDFVKGRNALNAFETEIVLGIDLHRSIDLFTDKHPVVTLSKNRLRPKYRHYAGVIVDVFYDHFLAKNWDQYHRELLPDFAERTYRTIERFEAILPKEVKYMMPYMTKGNWLVNYSKVEGIHRALSGMARRTTYDSKMDEAMGDLVRDYDDFKKEFDDFFPVLKTYCEEWLRSRSIQARA
jgi:acyl carrier protein phosphodiesterase